MVHVIYWRVDAGSRCSHCTATQFLKKTVSKFKDVIIHINFKDLFHFLGEEVGWKFFLVFFNPFFNFTCPMVVVNVGVH